ncbi:MAG: efflux RND transporter permease subunit [Candidatus Omnitrophota bacterium]
MGLPAYSVKRKITTLMIFAGILLIGITSLLRLPVELMPNLSFGNVTIIINVRGGIPPEEIEQRITKKIEEAVSGVSHLKSIESTSEENTSTVVLKFEPGIDMDFAALEVREKFARVKNKLPSEIEKPIIAKYEYSDVPIMILAMTGGKRYTPEALGKIIDDSLKPRLERIDGVAEVEVGGRRERKILVELSERKLQSFAISIQKVINVLNTNNLNLLAGDIESEDNILVIRTIGEFKEVRDISNIGIATTRGGSIIRLRDIAEVKDSFLEATSYARTNLAPTVQVYIQKESHGNTLSITNKILEEVEKFKEDEELQAKGIRLISVYNQGDFIRKAINDVNASLIYGAFLAILIIWIFLRDIKTTFVIALGIPTSIIATFSMMYFQKISLNVMTLSGLALGVGMLVDASIVVLDNIHKKRQLQLSLLSAVVQGTEEMWLAIVASTITTVIVFLPFIFVTKEIRMLYEGLALTIVYALSASLFVSISLVPLFSYIFNVGSGYTKAEYTEEEKKKAEEVENLLPKEEKVPIEIAMTRVLTLDIRNVFPRIIKKYRRLLGLSIRYRYYMITAAFLILLVAGYVFFTKIGMEFQGSAQENEFTIFVELPTGAKLDASDEVVKRVEKILSRVPEVKTVSSKVKPWSSRIFVKLIAQNKRERSNREIIDYVRTRVKDIPNAFIYFEEPQSSSEKELVLEVYGYDYDVLRDLAIAIAKRLEAVDGLVDEKIRMRERRPELLIEVDRDKAMFWNMGIEDVAETMHAKMRGLVGTRFYSEAKEIETIARVRKQDRQTFDDVYRLTIMNDEGVNVYLNQLSKFRAAEGPTEIWRKNKSRMIEVSATLAKLDLGRMAMVVEEKLTDIKFPKDYYYRFGGQYEKMIEGRKEMLFVIIVTIALVYMVLASIFASFIQPLIILFSVPMALIGVTLFLVIFDKPKSVSVFIGIVMLAGIVVNNAIVLIDRVNYFRGQYKLNKLKAIISAGRDRLRPILMTTLTTIFGLIPMALDRSEGAGLWAPLAITVLGGIISSTILTLFLIPSMYIIVEEIKEFFVRIKLRREDPLYFLTADR